MASLTPLNYRIQIEPDFTQFTFTATAVIQFASSEPVRDVVLNALELTVESCEVESADRWVPCPVEMDAKKETLLISLPDEMNGNFRLQIGYRGVINDQMAGFYRSRYTVGGEDRYIAVTQFEESDARRAFPCIDYPAAKATFDIEMIVDASLTALSNCDIAAEEALDGGKKRVRFERTPRMSTYLVFFGVGEFEIIEDPIDSRVRAVTLPGMKSYAAFGLEFGRLALQFCEEYYAIPYPLPKLDLIAIPDFAFGAMENWGAMTFRENLLLHYPNVTSRLGEARICEVIAHEIAHQWFGNLVTPSDWKYLWLNESFATYFGYGVVDHYRPEWQTWDHFLVGQTQGALNRDALHDTFPIEIPGGEHVVINTSTAPIIYSKGGSILRQVEGFIGSDAFQEGLRRYLKTHQYGCAQSRHLWEALEEASDQPIRAMMKSWVEQPGHPLVKTRRDGKDLVLQQQRFTYLPGSFDQQWMIPVTLSIFDAAGGEKRMTSLIDGETTRIAIGDDIYAYKLNRRQTGFYRVWYDDIENLQRLGSLILNKKLSPEDRWGIEHDLFALVENGTLSMDRYLTFLEFYEDEDAFLPLMSIAGNLYHASFVMTGEIRNKTVAMGKGLTERVLTAVGLEPATNEPHAVAILRDQLLWHAVVYGSGVAEKFTREQFTALKNGRPVHQDIKKSVLQAGAFSGDGDTFNWFAKQIQETASEHDRMNLLSAMGSFRDPALISRTQDYLLEAVPDRNRFIPVAALCQNPHAIPYVWEWYTSHIDRLEQSHPMLYERVIASILPASGLENPKEVKAFFKEYIERNPQVADVVNLSLEKLDIRLRMRTAG